MPSRRLIPAVLMVMGLGLAGYGLYLPAKAWLSVELLETAWLRILAGEDHVRPWPWMDSEPVARLIVTKDHEREQRFVVMRGVSGPVLAFAPGWHEQTALPGGRGNSVIAAHRDTHFAVFRDVRLGDQLMIEDRQGGRHLYEVSDIAVVNEPRLYLPKDEGVSRLLLVTCYPLDEWRPDSKQRLVVVADQIEKNRGLALR